VATSADQGSGATLLWEGEVGAFEHRGSPELIGVTDFESFTGWELRDEGLCNGDACVPVRDRNLAEPAPGVVRLGVVAALLDRPMVIDVEAAVVSIGSTNQARRDALIARRAPSFSLPGLDGQLHSLESLRGRLTVLVTFSTWCGCCYDLPGWQALYDELGSEGLNVVAIAFDQEAEIVAPFAEGITIPVLYDPAHLLSELYAISNVPTVVWIDDEGRVVRPNTPAFGTDVFADFHGVPSGPHLDAIREWVRHGVIEPSAAAPGVVAELSDEEISARLWFRIGAHLHRVGRDDEAAVAFERARVLAPLDFTVARAAMPLTGRDPFGAEFMDLYDTWVAAGKPFHGLDPDLGDS
jgi:peroxiredoxin